MRNFGRICSGVMALLNGLLGAAILGVGVVSVIGLLARNSIYYADLVANFAHLSAPLLALGAIWFCFFGRGWQGGLAAALLAVHFPYLMVYQDGAGDREVRSAVPLKVVSYNVLEMNGEREKVGDFLLEEDADLLLLLEVDQHWRMSWFVSGTPILMRSFMSTLS